MAMQPVPGTYSPMQCAEPLYEFLNWWEEQKDTDNVNLKDINQNDKICYCMYILQKGHLIILYFNNNDNAYLAF